MSPHAGPEDAAPSALPRDHPLAELQAEDRTALGVALAQTLFCALAEGASASCSDGLQRLLTEVFANDIAAFRRAPARSELQFYVCLPCSVLAHHAFASRMVWRLGRDRGDRRRMHCFEN